MASPSAYPPPPPPSAVCGNNKCEPPGPSDVLRRPPRRLPPPMCGEGRTAIRRATRSLTAASSREDGGRVATRARRMLPNTLIARATRGCSATCRIAGRRQWQHPPLWRVLAQAPERPKPSALWPARPVHRAYRTSIGISMNALPAGVGQESVAAMAFGIVPGSPRNLSVPTHVSWTGGVMGVNVDLSVRWTTDADGTMRSSAGT